MFRHPDGGADVNTFLWAHHEKLVVVDQLYAFVTSQPWEEGVCDLAGVCSEVKIKGETQP